MGSRNFTAAPDFPIPTYIYRLNDTAKSLGLSVSIGSSPDEDRDSGERFITAIWRGTEKQVRAACQLGRSCRFPLGDHGTFSGKLGYGEIFREGKSWRAELYCVHVPTRIEKQGDIEVLHYPEEKIYSGSRDALIAAKVCEAKQLPGDRRTRRSRPYYDGTKRYWYSQRLPDGTHLYAIENEAVFLERKKRREEHENAPSSQEVSQVREPETAEEYRRRTERTAMSLLHHLKAVASAKNAPFRFDDETLEQMRDDIAELLCTIHEGRIVGLRSPINPDRIEAVKAAETDAKFQRFLGRLNLGQPPETH